MKCFATILLFLCVAYSSAQELPAMSVTETPIPLSQKLRELAKRIEQATNDSQDDLTALLQEQEQLSNELLQLQTEASESEKDLKSTRESAQNCYKLLTNSIKKEVFWRQVSEVSLGIMVVETIILLVGK